MSYILDALNKSEQERREQDNVPSLQAIHDGKNNTHPQTHSFPWMPIAVVVVVLSLLLVIFMLSAARNNDVAAQKSPAPISSIEQTVPLQTTLVHTRSTDVQLGQDSGARSILSNAQSTNTPSVKASSASSEVDALYAQEREPDGGALTAVPSSEAVENKVDNESVGTVVTDYQSIDRAAGFVPSVQELPQSLQSRVPALDYAAHIYSSDERSGFAIINGKSRYKGDILSRDLYVEAVEEDGLLLNVQGVSFKIPAMKSWQPPR